MGTMLWIEEINASSKCLLRERQTPREPIAHLQFCSLELHLCLCVHTHTNTPINTPPWCMCRGQKTICESWFSLSEFQRSNSGYQAQQWTLFSCFQFDMGSHPAQAGLNPLALLPHLPNAKIRCLLLSLTEFDPWNNTVKGENQFPQVIPWPLHVCHGTCLRTHMKTK